MSYTVNELCKNLDEKITNLGINPKFRENPAYEAALSAIDGLISQMNMFEEIDKVKVNEEKGAISFTWTNQFGVTHTLNITCPNPDSIDCVSVEEKAPYHDSKGNIIKEKIASEESANFDNNSGMVTIYENSAYVSNMNCKYGKCFNTVSTEMRNYDNMGLMREREYKTFNANELDDDISRVDANAMLDIPRQAFTTGFWSDKYFTRIKLVRDQMDTARCVYDEKPSGKRYSAITPLSSEHGLRDMYMIGDAFQKDIEINPLSSELIEMLIKNEKNQKVADALRFFAVDREKYYYSTSKDPDFVYEGFEQTKEVNRQNKR